MLVQSDTNFTFGGRWPDVVTVIDDPLRLNFSIHILCTIILTFLMELTGRVCLTIRIFFSRRWIISFILISVLLLFRSVTVRRNLMLNTLRSKGLNAYDVFALSLTDLFLE